MSRVLEFHHSSGLEDEKQRVTIICFKNSFYLLLEAVTLHSSPDSV
jgi:hypothetical protein